MDIDPEKISSMRQATLKMIKEAKTEDVTGKELDVHAGDDWPHKCLAYLRRAKLIRGTRYRKCKITGNTALAHTAVIRRTTKV